MRKIVALALLLVSLAVPAFADVTDMMVNVGLQNSSSVLTLETEPDMEFSFDLNLQADFNLIIDNGPGVDLALTAEQNFSNLELGVYYSHLIDVRNNFDMILSVGPSFTLMSEFAIGVDFKVNFLIDITDSFYVNVGTGVFMDVVSFPKNGDPEVNVAFEFPLPSVALGFKF